MEILSKVGDVSTLQSNTVILGGNNIRLSESKFLFKGQRNILYLDDNINIKNSLIEFNGDGAACFIGSNKHSILLRATMHNNTACYVGTNIYFNGCLALSTSEQQNIILGNDCLFSFGIWIRTADPHLIYDIETGSRINLSKSVLIGDHVWIGQHALILKGACIGSGSIVGGNAVVTAKRYPSNVILAGNPVRIIRENAFYSSNCVHQYTDKQTSASMYKRDPAAVFNHSSESLNPDELFHALTTANADEKLKILLSLAKNKAHNRFAGTRSSEHDRRRHFFDLP